MTGFLPGFFDADCPAVTAGEALNLSTVPHRQARAQDATPAQDRTAKAGTGGAGEPERLRFDHGQAFRLRVRLFVATLSPTQRAEVARRPRFRNQPYLRRADAVDPDDFLP